MPMNDGNTLLAKKMDTDTEKVVVSQKGLV